MAKHKIKDPKAVLCFIFGLLSFSAIIVLFTIGGVFFADEHPKVLNYANSMCQVDSSSYRVYQCKSRYYTYSCYGPTWNVRYGKHKDIFALVEIQRRYSSYSDALHKADEYEVGSSYSCWYDTRNPSTAQWDQPSTRTAVILLSCGGLSILLTVMFSFLFVKLIQQEILQRQHDNSDIYSHSNPYVKQ